MVDLSGKVGFMGEFPDFKAKGFDIEQYNRRFRTSNLIINATACDVSYPKHWGPLSVKCAWRGREFYQAGNGTYAVDDDCFLLLDRDRTYSSWIPPGQKIESFTVNISPGFQRDALRSLLAAPGAMLDDPFDSPGYNFNFNEQLYMHDGKVTPLLREMRRLANEDIQSNNDRLHELFVVLMEGLVNLQLDTTRKITTVDKLRVATKEELFKRLSRARDFLYSVYDQPVDLEQVAAVACLNQHYFLRQFRTNFGVTPHQFLTHRRMEVASRMLRQTDTGVMDVCHAVGYADKSSFTRSFKRHVGLSPTVYRAQFQHAPAQKSTLTTR